MPRFKLVFFAPVKDTSRILNHIFAKMPNDVGKIGEYQSCAFMTRGTGQFLPGSLANPAIGKPGQLEFVEEDRVEVLVSDKGKNEEIRHAVEELKRVRSLSLSMHCLLTADIPYRSIPTRRLPMMYTD